MAHARRSRIALFAGAMVAMIAASAALAVGLPEEVNVGLAPIQAMIPGVGAEAPVDVTLGPLSDLHTGLIAFSYDPAIVTAVGSRLASEIMFSPSGLSGCNGSVDLGSAGLVRIELTCPTPAQSGGLVAEITFRGVASGVGPLAFADSAAVPFGCLLNDPCSQPPRTCTEIDCLGMDGTIAVLGGPLGTHTRTGTRTPIASTPTAAGAPATPTTTATRSPLPSPTSTSMPTASASATASALATATPSPTATLTSAPSPSSSPLDSTSTPTGTVTGSSTAVPTDTSAPSPTASEATTTSASASPTAVRCVGNCNGDQAVTVNELIQMVNIALGAAPVSACRAGDTNGDGMITINEIIVAVNNALSRCP